MRYSPSTGGFYTPEIHGDAIPEDAIEITDQEHADLIAGTCVGKIIAVVDGAPALADPPEPPLEQTKAALCAQVDAVADTVYVAIGGPSPGRMAEYQQAKADAQAFQSGGYAGTAPETIACWSQAKGWTDQAACDDILATAAQWEGALVAIRTRRLTGKANVAAAADAASAQAAADAAIASIRAVVGA